MTDNPKDAERLAEIDRIRSLKLPGNSMSRKYDYTTVWWLRDLLASRDATIADLEATLVSCKRMAENAISGRNDYCAQYKRVQTELYKATNKIADLERRLAEAQPALRWARAQVLSGDPYAGALDSLIAPPPPVAEASGETIQLGMFTVEQREYLRSLNAKARDYDPETIIGDPEAERQRLAAKAQPTAEALRDMIAAALTAAERAGAEKQRALDEAVIEAARAVGLTSHTGHWDKTGGSGSGCPECHRQRDWYNRLQDALATRDAALTEG